MDDSMGRLVYLPAGASGPDPEAFLEDVLTCWRRAQLAQGTSAETIRRRQAQVLRMTDFVGTFPWQWTPADADDFFGHLRGVLNRAHSTVRANQTDVKLFLDYATNPAYDWNEHCGRLFGTVFSQVNTEFNCAKHIQVDDSRSLKRPFTLSELQQFFDLADLEPERILRAGRKGALAAWRDAVAFKTLYGWGLRRNEVRHLQLVDFSRNARAPFFGEWGLVRIRHGKAMRNSPPKQRTVLTVFDWAAEAVADWGRAWTSPLWPPRHRSVPHRKGWPGAPNATSGSGCATSSTNSGFPLGWTCIRFAAPMRRTCKPRMATT